MRSAAVATLQPRAVGNSLKPLSVNKPTRYDSRFFDAPSIHSDACDSESETRRLAFRVKCATLLRYIRCVSTLLPTSSSTLLPLSASTSKSSVSLKAFRLFTALFYMYGIRILLLVVRYVLTRERNSRDGAALEERAEAAPRKHALSTNKFKCK